MLKKKKPDSPSPRSERVRSIRDSGALEGEVGGEGKINIKRNGENSAWQRPERASVSRVSCHRRDIFPCGYVRAPNSPQHMVGYFYFFVNPHGRVFFH